MIEEADKVLKKDVVKKPERRIRNRKKDKVKPMTKIIIRLLPPTMTEDDFIRQIEPLPDHESYYYVPADWSLGQDATCRAYITFTNFDDVFLFTERFDGYVFVDHKGVEYPAVVEYAPFQGLPKNRSRKKDPKVNTIESEPHFIRFLEKMKEDRENKNEVKVEFNMQPKDVKKITSTPLLQYLADKAEARRNNRKQAEESRRQRNQDKQQRNQKNSSNKDDESANKGSLKGKDKDKQIRDGKRRDDRRDRKEERKELYIKQRNERDQRRQEEREQRKQRDKDANLNEKKNKAPISKDKPVKDTFYPSSSSKQHTSDAEPKRREVKKYSERRDRNRPKPENKKIEEPIESNSFKDSLNMQAISVKTLPKNSNEINDSVQNFIDTVSKIREFVPNDNLVAKSIEEIEKHEFDKQRQLNEQNKKLENPHQSENDNCKDMDVDNTATSTERAGRRIRNKDRPTLQIYKPGILRIFRKPESESSSAEAKESKSNSTSDCENTQNKDKQSSRKKNDSGRTSAELRDHRSNPTSDCESVRKESFSSRRKSDGYSHNSDCDSLSKEPSGQRKVTRYSQKRIRRAKENNSGFDETKDKLEKKLKKVEVNISEEMNNRHEETIMADDNINQPEVS